MLLFIHNYVNYLILYIKIILGNAPIGGFFMSDDRGGIISGGHGHGSGFGCEWIWIIIIIIIIFCCCGRGGIGGIGGFKNNC